MTLSQLLGCYSRSRGLRDSSIAYFRRCLSQLDRFLGRPATVHDLDADTVNRWLWSLRSKAPHYRRSLRTAIVALWRFAAELHLTPNCARVAQVRINYRCPRSWSAEEVAEIREVSRILPGSFRNTSIPRGRYFHTLIGAAWYLGLSSADLHQLTLRDFAVNGQLAISRQKTGQRVNVGLPPDEWDAVVRFACWRRGVDGPVWPLWGTPEAFRRQFRLLVHSVGLDGSWKVLRASAGTAYELAHPGQGHMFLGNTRDVFLKSYYDPRRQPATLPHAPRLAPSSRTRQRERDAG